MQHAGQQPEPEHKDNRPPHPTPEPDFSTLETVIVAPPPPFAHTASSHALEILQQRYDILAEAGRGAMGQVFKARDRETREIVALKILKPEIASDPAMLERFKSELLFARKITHKNVCRVYEFNRVDGVAFTSMEFVEGESLRSVLKRFGSLTQRKGTDVALQMCSGLKEAHSQGIVHRDLKPENVMLDTHGNVKIMDFGIARSMETLTLTTGGLVGTPAYMAPEQAAGKPVDHRADIYAMGLMLYEMFTGTQVFRGENAVAVALKHINEPPKPPREIEPAISPALERAILKCLEKEPDNRFRSIADLEAELCASSSVPAAAEVASTFGAGSANQTLASATPAVTPSRLSPNAKRTIGSLVVVALVALGVRSFRHGSTKGSGLSIDDEHVEIHSPNATVSITPDSLSMTRNAPSAGPPTPKSDSSIEIRKGQAQATNAPPKKRPDQTAKILPSISNPPSTPLPSPSAQAAPASTKPAQENIGATSDAGTAEDAVPEPAAPGKGTYVWVGRFPRQAGAQNAANKIEKLGLPVTIMPRRHPDQSEFFVVVSGPYPAAKIDTVVEQLKSNGFAFARSNRVPPGTNKNSGPSQAPANP